MLSVQHCSGLETLNSAWEGSLAPRSFGFTPKFPMLASISPDCGCLTGAQNARCQQSPAAVLAASGLTRCCVEISVRFKKLRYGMRSGWTSGKASLEGWSGSGMGCSGGEGGGGHGGCWQVGGCLDDLRGLF